MLNNANSRVLRKSVVWQLQIRQYNLKYVFMLAKPVIQVFFFFFPPHNRWFKFSRHDSLGAGLLELFGLAFFFLDLESILDDI